jgi:hypothetical protein
MATTDVTVPQQFVRFLTLGAFVFAVAFWFLSSILMSQHDADMNRLALKMILKSFTATPFGLWVRDIETGYIPFFLAQQALVASYALAAPVSWITAFLFDTKIQRKEKRL